MPNKNMPDTLTCHFMFDVRNQITFGCPKTYQSFYQVHSAGLWHGMHTSCYIGKALVNVATRGRLTSISRLIVMFWRSHLQRSIVWVARTLFKSNERSRDVPSYSEHGAVALSAIPKRYLHIRWFPAGKCMSSYLLKATCIIRNKIVPWLDESLVFAYV